MKIGVLALQGALEEHLVLLNKIGVEGIRIRKAAELADIDGLIIPGGESTVFGLMGKQLDLFDALKEKIKSGLPVWGTCAGLIFLSKKVKNPAKIQDTLGLLEAEVTRNGFGRQKDSFIENLDFPEMGISSFPAVFIRAPYLDECSDNVEILHLYQDKVVACKQDNIFATSFHPELTKREDFHQYFVDEFIRK